MNANEFVRSLVNLGFLFSKENELMFSVTEKEGDLTFSGLITVTLNQHNDSANVAIESIARSDDGTKRETMKHKSKYKSYEDILNMVSSVVNDNESHDLSDSDIDKELDGLVEREDLKNDEIDKELGTCDNGCLSDFLNDLQTLINKYRNYAD